MNLITKNKIYHNDLQLATHKRLFSHLSGEHKSFYSGNGLDFREIREYASSDDIRHINWKVTARSLTPCVNLFNEDKKLNVVLVYLMNGSIFFGSARSKKDAMTDILAHLSFAILSKKDRITTVFFSDIEEMFSPPTSDRSIQEKNIKTANESKPLGKSINFERLEQYLLEKIKTKSLIFFIGDFLEMPSFKFLAAKHELYCAIIRDKFEEDLNLLGDFTILDTNSQKSENIFLEPSTIKKYNSLLKEHDKELISYLKKSKIRHEKIYTDDLIIPKLARLVRN